MKKFIKILFNKRADSKENIEKILSLNTPKK